MVCLQYDGDRWLRGFESRALGHARWMMHRSGCSSCFGQKYITTPRGSCCKVLGRVTVNRRQTYEPSSAWRIAI